jgi:hypothetical protein
MSKKAMAIWPLFEVSQILFEYVPHQSNLLTIKEKKDNRQVNTLTITCCSIY